MKSSLSVKINTWIILTVGLCVVIFGIFEFLQTKAEIEQSLDVTLRKVSQRLGNSLATPVWNIDNEVIEGIVTTEMLDENVSAVAVKDALSDRYILVKTRSSDWEIVTSVHPGEQHVSRVASVPLIMNNTELGAVSVFVTDRFLMHRLVASVGKLLARMGIILVLVVLFLIVFINRIVSRPIMKLNTVCNTVAHGDFDLEINVSRNDEIGSLARSFAVMQDAVKEKICAMNEEITERKRSEVELIRLRSYLDNIVNSMPSILVGVDGTSLVTQWNLEAVNATRITKEEAIGQQLADVLPCMRVYNNRILASIRQSQTQKESRVNLEIGGGIRITDITIYPLVSNGSDGAVIRLDDVTERVRLEEVMIQTEKMMSVGGLAAGMAHEINNPLAGIMQSTQVIQGRVSADLKKNHEIAEQCGTSIELIECYLEKREISKMLTSILESGKRASRIINNMLSFSRKSVSRYTPCDIKALLESTVELASNDYDLKKKYDFRKIEIIRQYDDAVMEVRCDATTIQQVFLNILKNATQAMAGKQDVEDEALGIVEKPKIRLRIFQDNVYVKIAFQDNGIGMDTATQKRIFEPFFTTKKTGIGTGLGLSVSYFIVKDNHNGTIEVFSNPGIGTTFTVCLPRNA